MVWGMSLPLDSGEFWPQGEFEPDANGKDSWRTRLVAHYLAQTREEQKRLFNHGDFVNGSAYASFVSGKFINEPGATDRPNERPPFSPIEPHEPPRCFYTYPYKSLGSLIKLNDRILAVDEDLKAIIEEVEPGVHQFFPIAIEKIKRSGREPYAKAYYTLVIGQYLNSFSVEQSEAGSFRSGGSNYGYQDNKKSASGLAFSHAKFRKAHFWRERNFLALPIFFSDKLHAEITKAGLRIPKHYRMKEV
jgi:hypothetical protein